MEEKKRKKQISHRLKTRTKNAMEALFKIKNDAVELIISKIQVFSFWLSKENQNRDPNCY
jgi:hypothetical protein